MTTLTVEQPKDLVQHIGKELGPSDWMTVDQAMIDRFAEATGDHQWIHVDVERAKREMPGGKTIAHGYLTLSLVPRMAAGLVTVTKRGRGINYGSNKVRFTSPVPAGSRIRLRQRITAVDDIPGNGVRVTSGASGVPLARRDRVRARVLLRSVPVSVLLLPPVSAARRLHAAPGRHSGNASGIRAAGAAAAGRRTGAQPGALLVLLPKRERLLSD